MTDFPQILVYYLHWHSVSFTVKNTPDLVKISGKNIVCVCVFVCVCMHACVRACVCGCVRFCLITQEEICLGTLNLSTL